MLSFEPRIAVIDDKIEEVKGIIEYHQEKGIGIKYYNANLHDGDAKPPSTFSNVNLIYLDVHFTENTRDYDPAFCAEWVDSLVPEFSFYILVIWSRETEKKDDILRELKGVNKLPFVCIIKQKTDFHTTEDDWDFERLNNTIEEELNEYPELKELAVWKKSILYSSNSIIGHLTKGIESEALKKKLQKIILGHGGSYLIGDDKETEKREVLFDALDSILMSNSKITRPNQDISEENKSSLYNISTPLQGDIDTKLNSWFHFNLQSNLSEQIIPGLISKYKNESLKKNYNIRDDNEVKRYLKYQLEAAAKAEVAMKRTEEVIVAKRKELETIAEREKAEAARKKAETGVKKAEKETEMALKIAKASLEKAKNIETTAIKEETKAKEFTKEVINKDKIAKEKIAVTQIELIDVALLFSRPCDIAQNKFGRNLKLIGGILIKNPERKNNSRFKGKDTMPSSLKMFDHLHFSEIGEDCSLIFDFRYSFSLPPNIFHERFEKIKLFNKELLSEIQVEYSSYSSRLGITQII